ncbi:MAG: hypothetical protein IPM83_16700 [Ignavibacteria bacterium]|nr:hypothetical protein [Ignavibacteria bacterium]
MNDLHPGEPRSRIQRAVNRATLLERSGDLDAAAATLQLALSEAHEHGLRSLTTSVHKALRDLAQKRNDFAGYIEHNNEFTRITEEINGKDTATKLAIQAKQREIDAERKETDKHMAVLHSTLPKHIADRVARGEVVNDHFENASVLFVDAGRIHTPIQVSSMPPLLSNCYRTSFIVRWDMRQARRNEDQDHR